MEYITNEMKEVIAHLFILGAGAFLGRYAFPYNPKIKSKIDNILLPKE